MRVPVWLVFCLALAAAVSTGANPPPEDPDDPVEDLIETMPAPDARPPHIRAMDLAEGPAPGTGRLRLVFDGNRLWCTTPDDRIVKPPLPPGRKPVRGPAAILTFGYQMTIAAVKRGSADETIMLFESPLIRTASWRPASKAGLAPKSAKPSPRMIEDGVPRPQARRIAPDQLVPYWHEINRCATVADRMDFDLPPGVYDIYLAIDLLTRSGTYIHRSTAFLLDVTVEAGRHTRVDGRIEMRGGGVRDVELLAAVLPEGADSRGSAVPSGVDGSGAGDP